MADGRIGVCGWQVHRGRSPGDIQKFYALLILYGMNFEQTK